METLKTFRHEYKYVIPYGDMLKIRSKLDEILTFRNDSVDSYFLRQKRKGKSYNIRKLFGKIFYRNKK